MEIVRSLLRSNGDLEFFAQIQWRSCNLHLDSVKVDSFIAILLVSSETNLTRGKFDSIRIVGSIGRQWVCHSATQWDWVGFELPICLLSGANKSFGLVNIIMWEKLVTTHKEQFGEYRNLKEIKGRIETLGNVSAIDLNPCDVFAFWKTQFIES